MAAAVQLRLCGVFLIFLFCLVGLCQSLFSRGDAYKRQLSVELNPGSRPALTDGDLLHVRAVGNNDTLHFLFCSLGAPTLLLVHTSSSNSTVTVDWLQFLARNTSGTLKVEPESSILYSTAVVFSRLWEYNDVNDTAHPTSELFPPYELQNFTWSHLNLSGSSALLCGVAATFVNGTLCFQLSVFASEGRGQSLPHLLHSANSSQLSWWLDGVLPQATRSRFLLELQAVGGAYPLSRVDVHRSIDDEFTPSIFKVSQWVSSMNGSSEVLGFVQWKPVAYRQSNPALENATPCRHTEPQRQSGEAVAAASGLIRAFYSEPQTFGLNMSFGLAGDPFYNSTKFLGWTMLVGVGSPPVDSFSPMVLAIMAVGLGTPMILLLVGGLWVCIRKMTVDSTIAYEPIN
ncbi:glycosylated lysosomal membrane protein [Mastacembelus armatus]|uniref:Glycosylated lysosomal membrane protein n=1 Tax=Mastacembelus armatus TaxID=205130 RepID=A0A3Q3MZ43_9TELE|nr:glycosylated lysosomal membrane protein [Mastacembelus armatus]XP_026155255.1 glycosylated lysosomal membrane protein [Mastacembelus armatus]XP_033181325.1 glycosylated lysosomal membrane protein [Mastacembelus armatus]